MLEAGEVDSDDIVAGEQSVENKFSFGVSDRLHFFLAQEIAVQADYYTRERSPLIGNISDEFTLDAAALCVEKDNCQKKNDRHVADP